MFFKDEVEGMTKHYSDPYQCFFGTNNILQKNLKYFYIQFECGKYPGYCVEYYQSHITMLWMKNVIYWIVVSHINN